MSDSLEFSPWNSLDQNTGVGSLSLLQGIFPTQGSNPSFPHCRGILYQLSHKGSTPQGWLKGNSKFLSFNTIMNMRNPPNTQDTNSWGSTGVRQGHRRSVRKSDPLCCLCELQERLPPAAARPEGPGRGERA